MSRHDKGSFGSFPGFRMENTRAYFHAGGKKWIGKIRLYSLTRRNKNSVEDASGSYSVRRLELVPFRPWDPGSRLEILRGELIRADIGGRESLRWRHLEVGLRQGFRNRAWKFLDTRIDSHLIREVRVDGSPASMLAWNLDQSFLLNSGKSGGLRKDDWHRVSISIVTWSELSAKHVIRNTWLTRSFVITMSRTSGVAGELMEKRWVCPTHKSDRNFRWHNHASVCPLSWSA